MDGMRNVKERQKINDDSRVLTSAGRCGYSLIKSRDAQEEEKRWARWKATVLDKSMVWFETYCYSHREF